MGTQMENSPKSRVPSALLTSVVGVSVVTAFAAWSPPSFRKLVLFAVAYGLCVGGIAIWSAKEFGLNRLPAIVLTVALTMAGLGMIAWRGYHEYWVEVAAAAKADADQAMARNIIEAAAEHDPQLAAQLAVEGETRELNFADYLAHRVKPLGEWSQPWPIVFWGAEVLLASACSAFLVSSQLRSPTTLTEEQT